MPKAVQISAEFTGLDASIAQALKNVSARGGINIPLKIDNRSLTDFNSQLDRATQRVITLGTAFSVLATANRLIRDMVTSTVEVEKSLTGVNAIFKLTTDNLNRFSGALFDISRETATSFNEVAKAATEFSRQGLSVAETQKAVRAALLLSRDANIDVEESVKALTAATNSFNKEALSRLQVANRLASVDAAFAVSSKDLAEALVRTGSAAADAGVSFNQFIGLVTAAQQISQRGGSVIAGALNTIFTRVNRKETLDALDSLGIKIRDAQQNVLPMVDLLQNVATSYDKMGKASRESTAELVGGIRQLNTLKATFTDLASEGSVFIQVQEVIKRNSSELERRNAARNQTISAQASQLGTTAQQVGSNLGNVGLSGPVKALISPLIDNPITKALQEANGSAESEGGKLAEGFLKGFGSSIVFGLGPILLQVLARVTTQVSSNLLKDVASISGIVTADQKRAAIEAEIVAIYKAGGVELQQQLATITDITQRAAALRSIMGNSVAGTTTRQLATAVMAQGPIRRSAGGYIPYGEEASAIAAGVGGAPSNARPVYLPSFPLGGGQHGIVANTSEFIVPHMAGGGSAIFNQNMIRQHGLPPGSRPVAAGGFIPNAAFGSMMGRTSPPDFSVYPFNLIPSFYGATGPNVIDPSVSTPSKGGQGFGQYLNPEWSNSGNVERERKQAFDQAQAEMRRQQAIEADIREKKAQEMEAGFQLLEKEKTLVTAKKGLTTEEIATSEAALSAYRGLQRSTGTLRPYPSTPVPPTFYANAAIAKLGTVNTYPIRRGGEGGSGAGLSAFDALSSPGPETDAAAAMRIKNLRDSEALIKAFNQKAASSTSGLSDTDRIKAVYRQQQFEESQVTRQEEIVAQNTRLERLRKRLSSARLPEFIGPQLPTNWSPPPVPPPQPLPPYLIPKGPSLASRAFSRLNSPLGSLALGIGLPFVGGNINDGIGGTDDGMIRGAAKNALDLGGTGATVGSFIPGGTLPGLAIGAALGALTGWMGKATKSFEELSTEIDQRTKKLGEEASRAGEVFKIEMDLREAIIAGNQEQVIELKKNKALAIAGISNPKYLDIISKYSGNPEQGGVEIARAANNIIGPHLTSSNLLRDVVARSKPSQTENILGALGGTLGFATSPFFSPSTSGGFGIGASIGRAFSANPLSKESKESGTNAMMAVLAQFSKADLDELRKMAKEDLPEALSFVGQIAGLDQKGIAELAGQARGKGSTESLAGVSLFSAINNLSLREGASGNNLENEIKRRANLTNRAAGYRVRGGEIGITGNANAQIEQIRQQFALNNPSLSDEEKLLLQREQSTSRFGNQYQTQQKVDILSGKDKLTSILASGSGSQEVADLVDKLSSGGDVRNLAARISTTAGRAGLNAKDIGPDSAFNKALQELIVKLDESTFSLKENTRVAETSYETALRQLQFDESYAGALNADVGRYNRANKAVGVAIQQNAGASVIEAGIRNQEEVDYDTQRRLYTPGYTDRGLSALRTRNQLRGNISSGRESRQAILDTFQTNPSLVTGSDLTGALLGNAQDAGRQGNAQGSFTGGFTSIFAGAKRDAKQFAEVGAQVATSLKDSFSSAFGDFVTGTKKAKDAFRDFVVSVLSESARIFATKAITSLLGSFFGGISGAGVSAGAPLNVATGGPINRASGGTIPTVLTGGEYVYGPTQAARIGGRMLNALNTGTARGFAPGGLVRGGSGVKDDVFQHLAAGSYVIRKASVERYGADNLASLSIGGMPDAQGSTSYPMAYAGGGGVASMMSTPAPITTVAQSGGGGVFNIGVTINDHSTSTQSSSTTAQGGDVNSKQFGETLARRVRQVTLQTIQEQQRMGGILMSHVDNLPTRIYSS